MKDLIIIGAGGVGKETAYLIEQINQVKPTWNLLGFVDDNTLMHGKYVNGFKVLGGVNCIFDFHGIYTVCAIASFEMKKRIFDRISMHKLKFAQVIHPSVHIPRSSSVGEGSIIYPGVIMTTNITVGNHVIISPGCGIGHESEIGDFCSLLWNVNISGNVRIEAGCLIGTGSTIIQNIRIGKETIVGAGTVVLRDLPQRCTAVGVPARIIKTYDEVAFSS